MDHELTVRFTHSNTVRDKRPYTIYEIEVRSSSTITWVIYKRYNSFFVLHQDLFKAYAINPAIRLPHLPPKRLTRSLASEFVEKRKQELQEYLKEILSSPELLHSSIVVKFLEVPDSVKPMLTRTPSTNRMYPGFDLKDMTEENKVRLLSGKADSQHKSYEERRVLELINLLKYHPNKVAAIKSFEDYFFQTRPRFPDDIIQMLFQGKPSSGDLDGGLCQCCGDIAYSQVASRSALFLLCRLLDVEKNKDAQLFLDQFTSLHSSVLTSMNLHYHILSEKGTRMGAFRIVQVLVEAQKNHYALEDLVNDTWARQEYFRWAERKTTNVGFKEPQDVVLKSVSLDAGYKNISQQMFQELLKVAKNTQDYRVVVPVMSYDENENQRIEELKHVHVSYKKGTNPSDMVIVRVSITLPFDVDVVSDLLLDLDKRTQWDPKFVQGKVLQKFDKSSDVVHMVFKSHSSPYKYRDFVLFRSSHKIDGAGKLLAFRSVLHPMGSESKDNVRAVLFPSGYIITPTPQPATSNNTANPVTGQCMLTYIAQMDKEAVLTVAPDLLGETHELSLGIANIAIVLARAMKATPRGDKPLASPVDSTSTTMPTTAPRKPSASLYQAVPQKAPPPPPPPPS